MRTSSLLLALASTLVACGTPVADLEPHADGSAPEPAEEREVSGPDDGRSSTTTPVSQAPALPQEIPVVDAEPMAEPSRAPAGTATGKQAEEQSMAPRQDVGGLLGAGTGGLGSDDALVEMDESEDFDGDLRDRNQLASRMASPSKTAGATKSERKKSKDQARTYGPSTVADASIAAPPPAPPPTDVVSTSEGYTHYGVNPMTLSTRDSLSTFSIDVDTASYSIARRKLRSGALPPTASVRVEEFVNSHDYGYAPPTDGAPFAVYLEAAPNPFLAGHHVLRVGVKGVEIDADDRAPVHLTFLVDVSGSMSTPDKLGLAKQSLHELVENLQPQDTVALATYAGHVARVLEPMTVSSANARTIHRAIDDLESGGGTGMSSGVDLAYQLASDGFVKGHENRVIVMSDGDANIGPASHTDILRQIKGHSERGITLSTIGFGMGNYKDVMMEQLANGGDGNYFYIDSMAEAQEVFGEDLNSTLSVIAKDVKIQVEFNTDAVYSYRLIGYENRDIADVDFRNDRVDAGEIGAGHSVTALYDVVLADAGETELATVRLRNKTPGADSAAVEWATAFPSDLLRAEFPSARDDFRLAYGAATFAELLRGSPYGAEVTYSELYDLVAQAQRRGNSEDAELLELIAIAGQLSGERGPVAWR